jgi:hypothetical protein
MKSNGSELVKEVNGTDLLDTLPLFNADAAYLQRRDEEKRFITLSPGDVQSHSSTSSTTLTSARSASQTLQNFFAAYFNF